MTPYFLLLIWITVLGRVYKQVTSDDDQIARLQDDQGTRNKGKSSTTLCSSPLKFSSAMTPNRREFKVSSIVSRWKRSKTTNANAVYLVIVLTLILFSGLRYGVGADFWSYYYGYKDSYLYSSLNVFEDNEIGVRIIARIAYVIFDHPQTFIFLCAAFFVIVSAFTIKKYSVNIPLSIFVFLCGGCYVASFNAIRQALAVVVIFWGIRYILEGSFQKWALCVLCAFLFHSSAVVFLPIFFLLRIKSRKTFNILLLLTALVLFSSYDSVFGMVDSFKGHEIGRTASRLYSQHSVSVFRVLAMCAPCFLCYYPEKISFAKLSENEKVFYNLTFFNAALAIIACKSAYLARICMYSSLYNVLSVPFLIKIWSQSTVLSDFERKTFPIVLWFLYVVYYFFSFEGEFSRNYRFCFI